MTFTAVRKDVCPNLARQSYDQMSTKGCAPETPPSPLVAAASSSLSEPWLQSVVPEAAPALPGRVVCVPCGHYFLVLRISARTPPSGSNCVLHGHKG